jgi:hypothetical protein
LCDLDRIIVHTNFTNTVSARHEIALEQLGEPRSVEIMRAVFFEPERLRPGQTSEAVTRLAAEQIAGIAESMRGRGLDAADVAHFLDRVVFCLFAEDIGLLPGQLFTRIAENAGGDAATFKGMLGSLFANMASGGFFGVDRIRHFNGSLFDSAEVPDLTAGEVKRIKESGDIFWAESDRDWVQDGANVHVSMAAFDDGAETSRTLDGQAGATINANLSASADTTRAARLAANAGVAFMGDTKVGPFDIPEELARSWLPLANPNGRPNNDVVRPWANGLEVTRAPQRLWIVDFPPGTTEAEAAQYEAPFEYIREHVKPMRAANSRKVYAERWWIHAEARPDMREALKGLSRYLVTPCIAKHRIFAWLSPDVLPDHQLIVFAREDDAFFGLLHSHIHEVWALKQGTQLEDRPRYTPTTCFETFPLPCGLIESCESVSGDLAGGRTSVSAAAGTEAGPPSDHRSPTSDLRLAAVASAAQALDAARSNWLGDRSDKTRTLTNLYNKRPQWLINAHAALDAAVAAAYGWPADLTDDAILERLLALNLERAGASQLLTL